MLEPANEAEPVEVRFDPSGAVAAVAPGTTILEAADLAGVDILTGCQRGMCGTDPVLVTDGADRLAEPAAHERGTLERMGFGPGYRLSCSARVLRGPVTIKLGEP